jgi:hypothetical protein
VATTVAAAEETMVADAATGVAMTMAAAEVAAETTVAGVAAGAAMTAAAGGTVAETMADGDAAAKGAGPANARMTTAEAGGVAPMTGPAPRAGLMTA